MLKLIPLCFCFLFILSCVFARDIKEADLAGSWYSNDPEVLKGEITDYLNSAKVLPIEGEVIALISPHAGLIYSGKTSAYGFKALEGKRIDKVILVGFSHRIDFDGIAAFTPGGFKTPLGILTIDKELTKEISSAHEKIFTYPRAFENENSVELIIPFIQAFFDQPKVVLLALGRQSWENTRILGQALAKALRNESDFLIIASTDMSHYLPLAKAVKVDQETVALLTKMNPKDLFTSSRKKNRMCGLGAVTSVMIAAKKLGANKLEVLKRSTSAEASGDESRVVGYLSAVMVKEGKKESGEMEGLLNDQQRKKLLKLARDTITLYLDEGKTLESKFEDKTLEEVIGVFVTLRRNHQLRGCIGNIIGTKPLYLGVRDMSIAAATQDLRFRPVTKDELKDIHIEISALSPLKQITNTDEIILGKHGVLVRDAYRNGVYLPQVATETGWSKEEFMNSLCGRKAGMDSSAWKNGKCDIYIFSAEAFEE